MCYIPLTYNRSIAELYAPLRNASASVCEMPREMVLFSFSIRLPMELLQMKLLQMELQMFKTSINQTKGC